MANGRLKIVLSVDVDTKDETPMGALVENITEASLSQTGLQRGYLALDLECNLANPKVEEVEDITE